MGKRSIGVLIALAVVLLPLCGCASTPSGSKEAGDTSNGYVEITFDYKKQSGYASNQFAVWIEDANGEYVNTVFATRFTARGGYQNRPDALTTWVGCSKIAGMSDPDAVSGATPKSGACTYIWDLTDANGARVPDGSYRFFVEGTLRWKNSVLYSGEIDVGGEPASTAAKAEYRFEDSPDQAALTSESAEVGMIDAVYATYEPPEITAAE